MLSKKTAQLLSACFLAIGIFAFVPVEDSQQDATQLSIALRYIGDQMLRQSGDSVSLVLPVQKINPNKYAITFERSLRFQPDSVVNLFRKMADSGKIPDRFTVEIVDKETKLTHYAFEFPSKNISCSGRKAHKKPYQIEVTFLNAQTPSRLWCAAGFPIALVFLVLSKTRTDKRELAQNSKSIAIGRYLFFPETQQLVFEREPMLLTSKEANVLSIFASRINEVIPRETLQKEVWENQGVIVGRSLDVFISRLRKKLLQDENVKIVNLHGAGYKLIVSPA